MVKPHPIPHPRTKAPRRWEPIFRWSLTAISVCSFIAAALSYAVCIRLTQRAIPQPDGSLIWHQLALHQGSTHNSSSFPLAPPAPLPLSRVEWVGFSARAPATSANTIASTSIMSGTPIFVLVPAVCATASWVNWLNRRRAERVGRCQTCNYDLRGLPPAAPCPECGQPQILAN